MGASPISTLVDLSTIHYNNLNLIVKKAVEYVGRMKTAKREINGVSYSRQPNQSTKAVRISLKSSSDGKFVDEYELPETYHQQLTLACFLFSVSSLTNLGTRGRVFCTNASGRGDTQMSISTKHCKSKLQERLISILNDKDFIDNIRDETNIGLPDVLSDIQKDLIKQSSSGEISKRDINRIKTNHSVDDLEIFLELEALKKSEVIIKSQIPNIDFRSFSIDEVAEYLRSNRITITLQKEVDSLSEQLDILTNEKSRLEKEIDRKNKLNLWQRIFNR